MQASTTRLVTLRLKAGVSVDDIPHQVRVAGENALVVVPGREPLCLRCHRSGHIRRECRVPRCALCRRFGHDESQCVRTYANVAEQQTDDRTDEYLMDAEDAEDAAKGADEEVVKDTPPVPAPAVVPEDTTPKKITVAQEEPESTDNASAAQRGSEVDGAPSHAEADEMETAEAGSFNASAKRAREAAANDEGIGELGTEEPPAKAAPQGRRSALKPKSNIPPDRAKVKPSET